MSEFIKLNEKLDKEEKTRSAEATKIQPILVAGLQSQVKALEAKAIEEEINLKDAEEAVRIAQATITKSATEWLKVVRNAEEKRDVIAQTHQNLLDSIEDVNKKLSEIFDVK